MGCSISRLEVRGRSTETGLRSIKQKIVDDVTLTRCDRTLPITNHSSDTAKLLPKETVGRNVVAVQKKDIVLGIPQQAECLIIKDSSPHDYYRNPSLLDGYGSKTKTEIIVSGLDQPKQTKGTNHDEQQLEGDGGGSIIPDFDGSLWMASPSFREYCLPDCDSDDDSVKGIAVIAKDNADPEKISNRENVTQQDMEIPNPNDDNHIQQDDSPGRSVKRRSNLRKVLTMRRPAAVRNFFSVTTCYNPLAHPSSHNGSRKSHAK